MTQFNLPIPGRRPNADFHSVDIVESFNEECKCDSRLNDMCNMIIFYTFFRGGGVDYVGNQLTRRNLEVMYQYLIKI